MINNDNLPVMLTVNQTAETFGIAKHHARQLALTGKVRAVRAGTKILINRDSVSEYFNSCTLTDEAPEQIGVFKPVPAKLR